jgi:6-phosphogluconolactonase (cycloisomerase 2 family)
MYSLQEEASTIILWRFNPATGTLTRQQQISSLPAGFTGTNFTSEIRVSSNGRFVYAANRLNDTIGVFSIGRDGRLTRVSHASTLGDYPRIFTIDPTGQFMVVGNQAADNVTTFRINRGDDRDDDDRDDDDHREGDSGQGRRGSLSFTGDYSPMPSASGIVFLT